MNEDLDQLEDRLRELMPKVESASHKVHQAVSDVERLTGELAEIQHAVKVLEAAVPDVANGQGELKFPCQLLESINTLQGLLEAMFVRLQELAKDPRVGAFFVADKVAPVAVQYLRHELATTYESVERLRWLMEESNIDAEAKGEPHYCQTEQQIDDFFASL